jgi:uncharacterized membrane protein
MASAPTPTPAASTGMSNNVAGLLCYVAGWITGLIFLLIEPYKNDKFVRFHAFQSIFFNVALIAVYIVAFIVGIILGVIHLGLLMLPIWLILWLGIVVVWVFLMVKAYNNQTFKLPIIGDLAAKQAGL